MKVKILTGFFLLFSSNQLQFIPKEFYSLNAFLTYSLGICGYVIFRLFKAKQTLIKEKDEEIKRLNDKIEFIYNNYKDDLKAINETKVQDMNKLTEMVSKLSFVFEQLKLMIDDFRRTK